MTFSIGGIMAAGFLTFLSPCVLPLVPVYLGILAGGTFPGSGGVDSDSVAGTVRARFGGRFRLVAATLLFVAGFTVVFSLLGLSATFVGRAMVAHRALFQQIGGLLILMLGLYFLGWLKLPSLGGGGGRSAGTSRFKTRFHYVNALLMGVAFAFVWTPCIGAVLGSVLTYTSLNTTGPLEGMALLAAYGAGFGLPLVIFSLFAGWVMPVLGRVRRFIPVFSKVTGGVLVAAGLLMNTGYVDRVNNWLNSRQPTVEVPKRDAGSEKLAELMTRHEALAPSGSASAPATCDSSAAGATCSSGVESRPVVLEFMSPGCQICRQMIPIVEALRDECADVGVTVRAVDVTTDEGRKMAAKYGVTGIPVFVFENAAGVEKARLVGRQTYQSLQQTVNAMSGRKCEGYRSLEFLKD